MQKRGLRTKHKLLIFLLSFLLAYFIFYERDFTPIHNSLSKLSYFGTFITGSFYTYGFTSPIATSILLILAKEQNILLAAMVGSLGSLFGDLIIFNSVRYSFKEEIRKFSQKRKKPVNFIKKYLLFIFGIIIIASPLPDELGISLLAFNNKLSSKEFAIISYLLNIIGILVILYLGKLL